MKKTIVVAVLLMMLLSLSGCFGGGVKLEEGQSHYIISEAGEMTMRGYIDEDELEDDFDVDLEDDEADIKDELQDYFDDVVKEFGEWFDMDTEVEVTEVKKEDDSVLATITFEDFEFLFMDWFESLEDLADMYGDFEILADEVTFVSFKDGEEIDEDDLENYADNCVFNVDGMEGKGAYYEFPSKVLLVDEDVEYERISDNIIFVEDGEYGYVVLEEELDGEVVDFFDMDYGDIDLDDVDLGDVDLGDVDINDLDLEPNDNGSVQAGNPNDLQPSQLHITYEADGSYTKSMYVENFDLSYELDTDETKENDEIIQDIIDYYEYWYGASVEVTSFERKSDGILFTIHTEDSSYMNYSFGYTVEEQAGDYDGYDGLLTYYSFVSVNDEHEITAEELENYKDSSAVYVDDYDSGSYFTFPRDIIFVDSNMSYELVDSRTIYVGDWSYGMVVY